LVLLEEAVVGNGVVLDAGALDDDPQATSRVPTTNDAAVPAMRRNQELITGL